MWLSPSFAALANLAPGDAIAADPSIEDIRIASHGHITRVVIDLSDQVNYHHIPLGQPPRLAIDLPKVDWALGDDASKAVGLIKGFRFGRPSPGVSRIVLDIAQPFEIDRIFELPPNAGRGHRLVTDLIELPVNGAVNGAVAPADPNGPQNAPW